MSFLRAVAQLNTSPTKSHWDNFIKELEVLVDRIDVVVACRSLMQCFGFVCFTSDDLVHKAARTKVMETFLQIAEKNAHDVWHQLLKHKLSDPEENWKKYDDSWVRRNLLEATFGLAAFLNGEFDRDLLDRVIEVERTSELPGKEFVIQYIDTKSGS
ncbi:hypothetical protein ACFL1U_01405 [Patescibacteria group bacterium]